MLPGMKVKKEGEGAETDTATGQDVKGGDEEDGERERDVGEEGEGDEERPSLPTPRKRLMNFKIPLVRGAGQRRDQQMSVVTRRKLFRGGMYVCYYTLDVIIEQHTEEIIYVNLLGQFAKPAKKFFAIAESAKFMLHVVHIPTL